MNNIIKGLLTGEDYFGPRDPIKDAVTERAEEIISTFRHRNTETHPGDLGYCYDGNRCKPKNLGWRFQQNARPFNGKYKIDLSGREEITVEGILAGVYDDLIEYTYHDAAGSEYWYRYEKNWD